jgi:hypothetical protein
MAKKDVKVPKQESAKKEMFEENTKGMKKPLLKKKKIMTSDGVMPKRMS